MAGEENSVSAPINSLGLSACRICGEELTILGLLFVVIVGMYSSALLLFYGFNDDYGLLDQALSYPRQIYEGLAAQGRPIFGWFAQTAFTAARGDLHHLWVIRLIGLIGLALVAWSLQIVLRRAGWKRATACCLAIIACSIPSVQVYASWASFALAPFAILSAVLAALTAGWILDGKAWRFLATPIPAGLLWISVITYQPAAMAFVAVMLLEVFSPARRDDSPPRIFGRLVFFQAINAAALFGGFEVFRRGIRLYTPIEGRTGVTANLRDKPKWFVMHPLRDSLNLWDLRTPPHDAIAVGIFLIVGLLLYFPGNWTRRGVSLLICALAIPLAHLPNILADDSNAYRTLIGLSWTILALGLLAINGFWRSAWSYAPALGNKIARPLAGTFLVLATSAAAICAAYTSTMFITWPKALELATLRMQLARPEVAAAHHLIFLQMISWSDTPAPFWVSDEFGCPSIANAIPWEPLSAVYLCERETKPNVEHREVQLEPFVQKDWAQPLPHGTAVIDMRRLSATR